MKILIAGAGKIGAALARKLSNEGYDLTVIDSNQQVLDSLVERYDLMSVEGNCASMLTLEEAGVKEADLLIAATSADEVNLLCCITARCMNPNIQTIARIRNPEYSDQVYQMRDEFALSLAVNPEKQAAVEAERLLKYPGFLKRDTFAKGRVEIVELRVDANSKLCDVALNDMDRILRNRVLVCAVQRGNRVEIPGGDYVLRAKDRIYVTASTHNLTTMLKDLGVITRKVRRVMICGGSRTAFYLAQSLLKSGIAVDLVERDRERCVHLAEMLPEANVVYGDASNQFTLESEGMNRCDALVAMTGMDELNVIISLYAESHQVKQVITKVSHEEHNDILSNLALGSLICPKELCSGTIVRYVRAMENQTGAALTVHTIADGQVEASEFRVERDTPHCGTPLKNISLKSGILLACINCGGKVEIPSGDSTYQEGDALIVVSCGRTINCLRDIFQ